MKGREIRFLEAVCRRMRQLGLVNSKAEFSVAMLGKGPSYLTSMKTREREVPEDVLDHLERQLQVNAAASGNALEELYAKMAAVLRRKEHCIEMRHWIGHHRQHANTEGDGADY